MTGRENAQEKLHKAIRREFALAAIEAEFRIDTAADGRVFALLVGWEPSEKFAQARRIAAANQVVLDCADGVLWHEANRPAR
jgi:hypothetical protein